MRPSDRFLVPLCPLCHRRQHDVGEQTFWGKLGIDPLDIAEELWGVSCDFEAAERCVRRGRKAIERVRAFGRKGKGKGG